MKSFISTLAILSLTLAMASPCLAQQKRISPHETISTHLDADNHLLMIVYGRPYSKDPKTGEIRKIWGGLVPWGQVWRTGSDEATLLITSTPLVIGGANVPAGCYSLFSIPNEDGTAKLIINKQIAGWGIDPREPVKAYDQAQDLARVDLKKETLDKPVDQFTMNITRPTPAAGGLITMSWETTQYSVPYSVQK